MKKLIMMTTTLALASGLSSTADAAKSDGAAVKAAIAAFVQAGDDQDPAALEPVLHPEFRVVFRMAGSNELTVLDRGTYAQLLEAKKIGGDARRLKVLSMKQRDGLAEATVQLDGAKARFEGHMTLVRTPSGWKLIQDATLFSPKAK
ncbi:MAG: nuclear transport factor 2 family protein [Myxococcota bacterium]